MAAAAVQTTSYQLLLPRKPVVRSPLTVSKPHEYPRLPFESSKAVTRSNAQRRSHNSNSNLNLNRHSAPVHSLNLSLNIQDAHLYHRLRTTSPNPTTPSTSPFPITPLTPTKPTPTIVRLPGEIEIPPNGFPPFTYIPDEPSEIIKLREQAFLRQWRKYLVGRRTVWRGRWLTPADPAGDSPRKQITVMVRCDMAYDAPRDERFPPHDRRMYEMWKGRYFEVLLAEEVEGRLEELRRGGGGSGGREGGGGGLKKGKRVTLG